MQKAKAKLQAQHTKLEEATSQVNERIEHLNSALSEQIASMKTGFTESIEKFQFDINEASMLKTQESTEMIQKLDKKIRGLHKRVKTDMEDNSGKVKADLGLL